ncbi:MAG: type II toxin-antitoxin system VapC family toxin [bacterium]
MIVLDTHVIIWDALQPDRLSRRARKAIAQANQEDGILFCDISLWEIAMLIQKRRVWVDATYLEFITQLLASNQYNLKRITPEIAELSITLPAAISKDPADRIIAATSIIERARLVTADDNLRRAAMIDALW